MLEISERITILSLFLYLFGVYSLMLSNVLYLLLSTYCVRILFFSVFRFVRLHEIAEENLMYFELNLFPCIVYCHRISRWYVSCVFLYTHWKITHSLRWSFSLFFSISLDRQCAIPFTGKKQHFVVVNMRIFSRKTVDVRSFNKVL